MNTADKQLAMEGEKRCVCCINGINRPENGSWIQLTVIRSHWDRQWTRQELMSRERWDGMSDYFVGENSSTYLILGSVGLMLRFHVFVYLYDNLFVHVLKSGSKVCYFTQNFLSHFHILTFFPPCYIFRAFLHFSKIIYL